MKTVLIVIFLLALGINAYLIVSYRQKILTQGQTNLRAVQNTPNSFPPPFINTSELPNAKKGVYYQSEILASTQGSHQDLEITVANLPEGLALGNCQQEFDIKAIPAPNTLIKCLIEGTPLNAGEYQLEVIAKITNGLMSTKATINLLVENRQ